MRNMQELVFLKLGGSLITEKAKRYTVRLDKLRSLAAEIRDALDELEGLRLVVGHGSGSFGHFAVQDHLDPANFPPSQRGRPRSETAYWTGFAEVWYRASQLNRIVVEAMHEERVPVVSISPSSAAVTRDGKIMSWDTAPLQAALSAGVMPLIFGDIVFDATQGGKVLSTEALIWHLATLMKPSRVLLAGLEAAVWEDFPDRTRPIQRITPSTSGLVMDKIGGSHGPDVTGGMKSKVAEMLALVRAVPGLTVQIFSGEQGGNIRRALRGEPLGTRVTSD